MKTSKLVAISIIALGVLHTGLGFLWGWPAWSMIAGEGFFNAVMPHLDRSLTFWFTVTGVFLIILGQFSWWTVARAKREIPRFLGWYLLVIGIVGGVMIPVSGFVLVAVIGAAALLIRRPAGLPAENRSPVPEG